MIVVVSLQFPCYLFIDPLTATGRYLSCGLHCAGSRQPRDCGDTQRTSRRQGKQQQQQQILIFTECFFFPFFQSPYKVWSSILCLVEGTSNEF
jgi:hypothetical protein